jgi:hypothetical protein
LSEFHEDFPEDDDEGITIEIAEEGKVMTPFCLKLQTVKYFMSLKKTTSVRELERDSRGDSGSGSKSPARLLNFNTVMEVSVGMRHLIIC